MRRLHRFALRAYHEPELSVLVLVLGVLFFLQARFLGEAAFTISDEGVHAIVGRLMFEGHAPYTSFSYSHPPLLSFLLGLSQQLTPSMLPPRLIYLFLNLTSAIPLFLFLRRLNGNAAAALIASLCYVTYFQMVELNFRFIALRQVANVFLIWFLYVGTRPKMTPWTLAAQAVLAIGSALVMFQAAANIALVSVAMILSAPRKKRFEVFQGYCIVGTAVICALLLFFVLVSGSVQATLLDHMTRPENGRWGRILWTADWGRKDVFFYLMSTGSLVLGAIFQRATRFYCFAALGIIGLVFAPRAFFPHYFDIGGPAFAIGIFAGVSLIMRMFGMRLRLLGKLAAVAVLAVHWTIVLIPLTQSWKDNKSPEYHALIQTLSAAPEPMLTFFEPIYAVESGRKTVDDFRLSDFRTFASLLGKQLTDAEYDTLSAKACTIFLVPWDTGYIPMHIQEKWLRDFERVETPPWAILLKTRRSGCVQ